MAIEPEKTTDQNTGSPYIRTFAKDFAALSGKSPIESSSAIPPKKKFTPTVLSTPLKTTEILPNSADSVVTDNSLDVGPIDLSRLESDAELIDAKTLENYTPITPRSEIGESISLPALNTGDIITATASETPMPVETERQGILARLRGHAEIAKTEVIPAPPIPEPVPEPIAEIAPISITPPSISVIEPVSVVQPVINEGPSPLHTYTSDFADRVEQQKASAFTVIAAEKDSGVRPKPIKKKMKVNFVPIVIGIALLILGSAGIYTAYLFMSKSASIPTASTIYSLIAPDSKVELSGTRKNLRFALADEANKPLAENDVLLTYINESTTTAQGVVDVASSGGAFITQMQLDAPDILLRNIDQSSMVGIVHAGSETRPFFILRVTSYERSFAGMLNWEGTIQNNLSLFYPLLSTQVPAPQLASLSTTTSSTSTRTFIPTTASYSSNMPDAQFIDEVVNNHDTRVLKDQSGRTILIYGYADQQTLIIARDEAAFTLLVSRLAANTQ
jgi:hypothetical protein